MTTAKPTEKSGVIYILQNPAFQETIIKIGRTVDLKKRMDKLYQNSGVPARFTCYYAREVENAIAVERKLHAGLDSMRLNASREFFEIDPEQAKQLVEIAPGKDVTPEDEFEGVTGAEKRLARRNIFRLKNFGIKPGEKLAFAKDLSIVAEVNRDGKTIVLTDGAPDNMHGQTYSLSRAASELVGYQVAGTDHWVYDGKTLNQIREEAEIS